MGILIEEYRWLIGRKGAERQEEIVPALTEAAKSSHVPCVIEFVIDSRWKVLPIVPPGKALPEMVFQ